MDRILSLFDIRRRRRRRSGAERRSAEWAPVTSSSSIGTVMPIADVHVDTSARVYTAHQILNKMLCTKTYIALPSFTPVDLKGASPEQIGKGHCGTIWGVRDIPRWENWVQPSRDLFWSDLRDCFPEGFQPTYGLLSTKIQPLAAPVCEALFDVFAPRSMRSYKAKFLARPENKDCLVRLYLGKRAERTKSAAFKLRNFELTVNEMEELNLDTAGFTLVMANALAVLHWKAEIDADDVEFVLGRAPIINLPPSAVELEAEGPDSSLGRQVMRMDCHQRVCRIWLLDFNQCRKFPKNEEGINQLQGAFSFNDPYYPRPISDHPADVALWNSFKNAYLQASEQLTQSDMPARFIDAVEQEGRQRAISGPLFG